MVWTRFIVMEIALELTLSLRSSSYLQSGIFRPETVDHFGGLRCDFRY